jgi:hypothetical protein
MWFCCGGACSIARRMKIWHHGAADARKPGSLGKIAWISSFPLAAKKTAVVVKERIGTQQEGQAQPPSHRPSNSVLKPHSHVRCWYSSHIASPDRPAPAKEEKEGGVIMVGDGNDTPARPNPGSATSSTRSSKRLPVAPRRGAKSGIGMILERRKDEEGLWVAGMMPGSPALNSGICVGDRLVEVDGSPVQGLSILEVSSLVCGLEGSSVSVSVLRKSQQQGAQEPLLHRFSLTRTDLSKCPADGHHLNPGTVTYTSWKPKKDVDEEPKRDRGAVDAPLAVYSCPTCDEGFAKWFDCLRHMRLRRYMNVRLA